MAPLQIGIRVRDLLIYKNISNPIKSLCNCMSEALRNFCLGIRLGLPDP